MPDYWISTLLVPVYKGKGDLTLRFIQRVQVVRTRYTGGRKSFLEWNLAASKDRWYAAYLCVDDGSRMQLLW